ncbi:NAD(P)H-dependent oxidoreductase [bacterium]|nr:NAD(P)H-dependent oxidoreductase [bacterium]MDB4368048.1 NAD(P)H-dependent oxidoreductase [Mariniblastus sp.]MDB4483842.1 NAD(P)H-dependent oxidoreductase [bacterium]
MKFSDAMRWRYATKKFDPQRLLDETVVAELLDITNLTPTSYGLQPFKFVVLKNQEIQDKLIASSYGQRQVADASHVLVIAARTDVDASYIREYVAMVESQRNLEAGTMDEYCQVMIGSMTRMSPESLNHWAAKQAYIALGTVMAACAALQIDACPMEGFVPQEYNEILNLGQHQLDAVLVVPIGYRAEDDATQHNPKVRRPIENMVIRI